MMGFLTVALFFFRFWKRTHDRLFAIFSIAFTILAAERVFFTILDLPREVRSWVYIFRLVAFLLIIWGVIEKNRETHQP